MSVWLRKRLVLLRLREPNCFLDPAASLVATLS